MTKFFGIIPARKGSKGIPNKNLLPINGIPLIDYSIDSSLESKLLNEIYLSTDSEEIIDRVKYTDIIAPGLRSASLSEDTTLSVYVVQDVILNWMHDFDESDYVVLLQPTSPLRRAADIDSACLKIEKISMMGYSLASVTRVHAQHPNRMKIINKNGILENLDGTAYDDMRPRQLLPEIYIRNGALYINSIGDILENSRLTNQKCVPFIMEQHNSYNIDSIEDVMLVERQLKISNTNQNYS